MVAAVLAAVPAAGAAQNGGLRGRVLDSDGEPLAGVDVTLSFLGGINRTVSFASDEQGNFVRMGVRLGEYQLALAREGFLPHEETIRIRPGAPTRIGEVVLRSAAPATAAPAADAAPARAGLRAGQAALAGGDYETAAAAFRDEVRERPESADAHRLLGTALRRLGETDEARSVLRRATELDPGSAPVWTAVADLETSARNWDAAITALEAALGLDPGSGVLRSRLGGALMNAGNLDRAAEVFGAVLEATPDDAEAHYQLGMIALNHGRNQEAIAHLDRVVELAPEGPRAELARGMLAVLRPG